MKKLFSSLLFIFILCLACVCFTACGGGSKPSTAPSVEQSVQTSQAPSTAPSVEPSQTPAETTYTIVVLYPDGTPVVGAVVQACNDAGNCYPFLPGTDENGSASKTLATDATLVAKYADTVPDGYTVNAEGYPFVNGVATIVLEEVSSTPSATPSVTPSLEPSVTPSQSETLLYSITVIDADGNPVPNLLVVFYDSSFNRFDPDSYTDENGTVTILLKPNRYLPQIDASMLPALATLPEDVYLTAENPSATLQLGAIAPDGTDYNPYPLQENTPVTVQYNGDVIYYAFKPLSSGEYTLTSSGNADAYIGHFGNAYFVFETPFAEDDNSADDGLNFCMTISVSENEIDNTYVFGVKVMGEPELPQTFTFVIERTGDYVEKQPVPENEITATENPKKYFDNNKLNETLVSVNLNDTTTIVYNEKDGYFRVGSEDGPLLLAKLTQTIAEFFSEPMTEWLETQGHVFTFFYEDKKDNYTSLFNSYAQTCNDDGVCPVTKELFDFLTLLAKKSSYFGENGWIGEHLPDYGAAIQEKNWEGLFACYYYRSSILGGNGTEESPYLIGIGSFDVSFSSTTAPIYFLSNSAFDLTVTAQTGLTVTQIENNLLVCSAQAEGVYSFTVSMKMSGDGSILNPFVIEQTEVAYATQIPGATEQTAASQVYFCYTATQSGTLLLDLVFGKSSYTVWNDALEDAELFETENGTGIIVEEGKTYYFIFTLSDSASDVVSITLSYLTESEAQE